jgi:hypothetical protein
MEHAAIVRAMGARVCPPANTRGRAGRAASSVAHDEAAWRLARVGRNCVRERTELETAALARWRMFINDARREALQRACHVVDGNLEKLRRLLGVPRVALCDWLAGRDEPPLPVFLRAVDLIDEAGGASRQIQKQVGPLPVDSRAGTSGRCALCAARYRCDACTHHGEPEES